MKYIIVGDSWGLGEFVKKGPMIEPVPDTNLDYYLSLLGHTTVNLCAGSVGNFGQLRNLYWTLKTHHDYDFIIWFHTEAFRDVQQIIIDDPEEGHRYFPDFDITEWNKSMQYVLKVNYEFAEKIYKEFNIPFIVIGGQAPIDPLINDYTFCFSQFNNLLAELLELDFEVPMNTIGSWHKIEKILEHYKVDVLEFVGRHHDELTAMERIEDRAKHSNLFPDDAHPGRECYKQIAQKIHEINT